MDSLPITSIISAACLLVLSGLLTVGLVSHRYAENWLQFAGMFGLMLWSAGRFWSMLDKVMDGREISVNQMLLYISLVSYALGTCTKVCSYMRRE